MNTLAFIIFAGIIGALIGIAICHVATRSDRGSNPRRKP